VEYIRGNDGKTAIEVELVDGDEEDVISVKHPVADAPIQKEELTGTE
jgi:hypothetical protein